MLLLYSYSTHINIKDQLWNFVFSREREKIEKMEP